MAGTVPPARRARVAVEGTVGVVKGHDPGEPGDPGPMVKVKVGKLLEWHVADSVTFLSSGRR